MTAARFAWDISTIEGSAGISDGLTYAMAGAAAAGTFAAAFDSWWRRPAVSRFPYRETVGAYQAVGKHFVSPTVTGRLARLRQNLDRVGGSTAERAALDRFLSVALDKVDGRYDYSSYCALPVLDLPGGMMPELSPEAIEERRDLLLLALIGDLLRFETRAHLGQEQRLPGLRPDAARATGRIRVALAVIRPSLRRRGIKAEATDAERPGEVLDLLARIDARIDAPTRHRIEISLLPVHTLHDEAMFLRILQVFEVNFAWIAVHLRNAIHLLETDPEAGQARLLQAIGILRETLRLMPLIGSMQAEAFHDFRRFTEGASAIQSSGYKIVEALCARPNADRVDSPAYRSVPEVAAEVRSGLPTLEDAVEAARTHGRLSADLDGEIVAAMGAFEDLLLNWRKAHFEVARRVLGGLEGTGYTEGVPYLDRVRALPVFPKGRTGP